MAVSCPSAAPWTRTASSRPSDPRFPRGREGAASVRSGGLKSSIGILSLCANDGKSQAGLAGVLPLPRQRHMHRRRALTQPRVPMPTRLQPRGPTCRGVLMPAICPQCSKQEVTAMSLHDGDERITCKACGWWELVLMPATPPDGPALRPLSDSGGIPEPVTDLTKPHWWHFSVPTWTVIGVSGALDKPCSGCGQPRNAPIHIHDMTLEAGFKRFAERFAEKIREADARSDAEK